MPDLPPCRARGQRRIYDAMTTPADLTTMAETLRQRLAAVHGIKGRTLEQALRRSGRYLPRRLRRQGLALAEAAAQVGHPQLERMFDMAALRAGYSAVSEHLDAVDVTYERRGWWLRLAGSIAFNLLIVVMLFLAWMFWRGLL